MNALGGSVGTIEILLGATQSLFILSFLLEGKCFPFEKTAHSNPHPWIPILFAWGFRLACFFTMASLGFLYFIPDDPCRWEMSFNWTKVPYFITWDGVWLGMTFYLQGLSMLCTGDPVVGSKIMTVILNLVALGGIYCFAWTLSRNRVYAAFAVVLVAPYFLHILLGTGALTEIPVVGFTLLGLSFLIRGLEEPDRRRRRWDLSRAAFFFMVSTGFHYVAWIFLLAVLVLSFLAMFWNRLGERRLSVGDFLLFALPSTLYCIAWMAGCWIKFGNPLHSMTSQMELSTRYVGNLGFAPKAMAYPLALLFSLRWIGIFVLFSIGWHFFSRQPAARRYRFAMAAAALALILFVLTSIRGGHNNTPYRSLIVISTILLVVAPSPFFVSETPGIGFWRRWNRLFLPRKGIQFVLAGVFMILVYGFNLQSVSRMLFMYRPDANSVALGNWLREEIAVPSLLTGEDLSSPIILRNVKSSLAVYYLCGHPNRARMMSAEQFDAFGPLRESQIVVSEEGLERDGLTPVVQIGSYTVYRYQSNSRG